MMDERFIEVLYDTARKNLYSIESVNDLISMGWTFHDIGYCIENNIPAMMMQAIMSYRQLEPLLKDKQDGE